MSIGNCKFCSVQFRSEQDERGLEHSHAPGTGVLACRVGVDVQGLGMGVARAKCSN